MRFCWPRGPGTLQNNGSTKYSISILELGHGFWWPIFLHPGPEKFTFGTPKMEVDGSDDFPPSIR